VNLQTIGALTSRISNWNPSTVVEEIPFLYIDLGSIDQQQKRITRATSLLTKDAPSRARQLVRAGDILVSTVRPNLNSVAVVPPELDGATASTGFCVLRPAQDLDASYLFHWVRSPAFVSEMTRKATGQSYPAVSDRIIKSSKIPLPPPQEQRAIAQMLDSVDNLRSKRRSSISLLDDLSRSEFYQMFGDVVRNDRGWDDNSTLEAVAEIASGITKGRKSPSSPVRTIPYVTVLNVQERRLDLSVVKSIEASEAEISRYRLVYNDLLLTEGGDPDKLGRGTLWRNELPECIHQNHIFRVRLKDDIGVDPVFLSWMVASERGRRYFLRSAKQTTGIASINTTQLKRFPLLLPPLPLQQNFARKIIEIERAAQTYSAQLTKIDELFMSLQSSAFDGKLALDPSLAFRRPAGNAQKATAS